MPGMTTKRPRQWGAGSGSGSSAPGGQGGGARSGATRYDGNAASRDAGAREPGSPTAGAANLSWSEFERERPDLAEAGRGLLYQFGGVGVAFLSTVRGDGGPRLHPMCPILVAGALVAHIIPSAKRDDLRRDGRFAMHSFPCEDNEDAFYVTGRAALVGDDSLARAAAAQFLTERHMDSEPRRLESAAHCLDRRPGPVNGSGPPG